MTSSLYTSYDNRWFPLHGPDYEDEGKPPLEIDAEEDFLGNVI